VSALDRLWRWAPAVAFVGFCALVLLSNAHDWDMVLSMNEVDRRSWLIDHLPPRWSYQLCAGSSRIGDPQAFGLSPLFLPVLLFGAFWGTKLLLVGCVLAGWFGLRAVLRAIFPALESELAGALAVFFLGGNFFLWHFSVGHLTFALIPLSCVGLALVARAFRQGLGTRDAALLALVWALIGSAGFYAVAVFWLLPLLVCLGLPALGLRLSAWPDRRSALRLVAALGAGMLLSAPKWLAVLVYQGLHPRSLDADHHVPEHALSLLELLSAQLSPTLRYDYVLGPTEWGPWDIWEYSSFSAISIAVIAVAARSWPQRKALDRRWLAFFALALVLSTSLFLHEDSALSLHHLLNRLVYRGSVRAIGRYGVVLQAIGLLFVAWRLGSDAALRAWARRALPVGYAICALQLGLLLANTEPAATRAFLSVERRTPQAMQVERFVKPYKPVSPHARPHPAPRSFMYASIARGEIVPNCHQPLRRVRAITTEARAYGVEIHDDDTIDLVDADPDLISNACRASISVTQSAIAFDPAGCPSDLCLNLNDVDPSADEPFALDEERGKFCRRR
jgi:hypothetical protein